MSRMEKGGGTRWIVTYESQRGDVQIEHRDGVSWMDAPIPHFLHRCSPQTCGWTGYFTQILRCACGSISHDGKHWEERNSRQRSRRPHRRCSISQVGGGSPTMVTTTSTSRPDKGTE